LKQNELQKPTQPSKVKCNEEDEDFVDGGCEEDWMFKTFDKIKAGQKDGKQANTARIPAQNHVVGRSRLNELQDFEEALEEESPFDMAPEMNIQLFKGKSV
jgi:hypothetical protein